MHRERYPESPPEPMRVIVNQAQPETYEMWSGTPGVSFVPDSPEVRRAGALGSFDFEGVGLNNFYISVLQMLRTNVPDNYQHMLPEEASVWVKPYVEAMKDFPEKLLRTPKYRYPALWVGVLGFFAVSLAVGGAVGLVSASEVASAVQASSEVSRPADEPPEVFAKRMTEIRVPENAVGRIAFDGVAMKISIKGKVTKEEIDHVANANSYAPFRDALMRAAGVHGAEAAKVANSNALYRQLSILAMVAAGAILVAGFLWARSILQQRTLLRGIIQRRSSAEGGDFIAYLKHLLLEDTGKERLRWLRDEFRHYNPHLRPGGDE